MTHRDFPAACSRLPALHRAVGLRQPPPAAQHVEASIAAHVATAARRGQRPGRGADAGKPAPAARPVQDARTPTRGLRALIDRPAPPPGRAFDNLYFVGGDWASAWAIDTPEGIVLIDALSATRPRRRR